MNPRESVGPKAKPNPTIHQAKAPVTASKMFFTTIPLQCCFLAAEASTIIKPSCMKKIRAVDAMIQLELAPVLIVSIIAVCAAIKGSTLAKFLEGSEKILNVSQILNFCARRHLELCVSLLILSFDYFKTFQYY